MSRFTASLVLVASLFANLAGAETRFASPPPLAARSEVAVPRDFATDQAELRIAPPHFDRAKVRAALVANRRANLARFRAYYKKAIYPSNVYADGLTNVWRDEAGHLCAAATIMKASGEGALVERIAEENNFIKLADVSQGPVMDWMLMSGFTQAELVAIQKPFTRVGTLEELEQTQPKPVVTIDTTLRSNETRRLLALYRKVDASLVKMQRTSLELAVTRIMKRPDLAAKLAGN